MPPTRPAEVPALRPLCVDLDGTLVATDTAWEALLTLIKRRPWLALSVPVVALGGLAKLKCWLTGRVELDAAALPYRAQVLDFLREQKSAGRPLVLATGAHERVAQAVADHLGLFDDVIATDAKRNCIGPGKCEAIVGRLGPAGYDYLGDSAADVAVCCDAREAYLVNPTARTRRRVAASGKLVEVFSDGEARGGRLWALVLGMRPQQWVKSGLLAVPMLVGQQFYDLMHWVWLVLAMASFSLAASAVYLLNDLFDIAADRQHSIKRHRPLAAGRLPIPLALLAVPVLLAAALLIGAVGVSPLFAGLVAGYVALGLAYTWAVKGKAILDVIWLAGLYVLRLIAGGLAVDVVTSAWLLGFAMFAFLSIAFAKRYAELVRVERQQGTAAAGRGYLVTDLTLLGTVGPVAGYMSVLVLALYITSDDVNELYETPSLLWLICPLLVYWLTRLWLKAHRRELREDPVMFTLTDPATYGVIAMILGVAVAAAWG
ncbi:MAG: UbiA family prenyltransferase [Phycisphaeraceae bacterium]